MSSRKNKKSARKSTVSKSNDGVVLSMQKWKDEANKVYPSLKNLRSKYKTLIESHDDNIEVEQEWVDKYLMPIINFMGDEDVWKAVIPKIEIIGLESRQGRSECKGIKEYPRAHFSGTHWTSCKANEKEWFNPYDHYQVLGTNQFCQTFAMLHLVDKLPNTLSSSWTRNYTYSSDALRYIEGVIKEVSKVKKIRDKYDMPKLKRKINECLRYPNICVNVIEYPRNLL